MNKQLPSIFLIVLDTLRADYAAPISNKLQRLGFISYENAITPAPWTIPSHASLITGVYPLIHGAHENKNRKDIEIKLTKNELNIVPVLSHLGYKTLLLSPNIYVSPYFGFKGFDIFMDTSIPYFFNEKEVKTFSELLYQSKRSKVDLVKKLLQARNPTLALKVLTGYGLKWVRWPRDKGVTNTIAHLKRILRDNDKKPVFGLINLLEVHEPYSKGETPTLLREKNRKGYNPPKKVVKRWKTKYPAQVEYLKKKVHEIIKILQLLGYFENSLIIVTSDHGQLLGEHGAIGHGTYLYDELLRVPLLIKFPENKNVLTNEQDPTKYVSLTKMRRLIFQVIQENQINDSVLYSDTVFAESYGIPERVTVETEEEKVHVENLEKYRVAIYYKNTKAVFNVTDWKFEAIDPSVKQGIKKKLLRFLKSIAVVESL